MLFLENVLRTMDKKANVLIMLSSITTYGEGELETPITLPDSCGNHHVENWLTAILIKRLEKTFTVKEVNVAYEDYMDSPQWTIILENRKDDNTKALDYESNAAACRNTLFSY